MNTSFFVLLSTLILGINCVVVNLKDGAINGTSTITKEGRLFHKFLGIPYAKPPLHNLRFRPPEPVEPWQDIKDVTNPPPICVQMKASGDAASIGQEDCLYLNVYVPDALLNSSGKAPVMVGIHGGAFVTGSANDYAADYFMERDVIFVSINYRLGVLGFLAFKDIIPKHNIIPPPVISMPGNYGLKDQSFALKWVNQNIAQFGGDPANVTLLGESAGAASVHFHMFSPLSKGLFQKAIFESGNAFSPWSHFDDKFKYPIPVPHSMKKIFPNVTSIPFRLDQIVALGFANATGCLGFWKFWDIPKCLRDIPAENFTKPDGLRNFLLYLPIIESGVNETEAFLPFPPNSSNYQTPVPWITGMNSGEGALVVPMLLRNGSYLAKMVNSNKTFFLPLLNLYFTTANKTDMDIITQKIYDYYFSPEDIGLETAHHAVDMITDSSWLTPLKTTVKGGPGLQYIYLYDHRGPFSLQDAHNLTIDLGVCHADELPLLYRYEQLEAKRTLQDRRVSDTLLRFWINFAISGDPNRHSKEKVWIPVQTNGPEFQYLHIKSTSEAMEHDLYGERYNIWKNLPING